MEYDYDQKENMILLTLLKLGVVVEAAGGFWLCLFLPEGWYDLRMHQRLDNSNLSVECYTQKMSSIIS